MGHILWSQASSRVVCAPAQWDPFPPFQAGAQIADPVVDTFNGQEVEVWPRITWSPRWGLTFKDVKEKVRGNSSISQRSALVINGRNIFLEGLSLDGTLIVNAADEAEVLILLSIVNYYLNSWALIQVSQFHYNLNSGIFCSYVIACSCRFAG